MPNKKTPYSHANNYKMSKRIRQRRYSDKRHRKKRKNP
jgi:hypothetical protein